MQVPHVLIQALSTTGSSAVSWILEPRGRNKTFPGPCAAQNSTGMEFSIPSAPWIHRNERLRRRWASSFLLLPRNKAEEVKKCSKYKKLWVEHVLCSGGADTNLGLHLRREEPALPAAGAPSAAEPTWRMWNLCSLSRFWHHHEPSSTGLSMGHCQTVSSLFPAQEQTDRSFQKMHQLQKFSLEEFC